jgi:hypothetical protein
MMAKILHHLEAMGWGWAALFLLLDAAAIACAVLAVTTKEPKLVPRAFLWSAVATFGIFGSSTVAQVVGLNQAFRASASGEENKARELAEGISTTMNAVAFGLLFTGIAGVACLVCLVMLVLGRKSRASS